VLDMKAPQRREGQTTEAEVEVEAAALLLRLCYAGFRSLSVRALPDPQRFGGVRHHRARVCTASGCCDDASGGAFADGGS
jgi:hypothetical protein